MEAFLLIYLAVVTLVGLGSITFWLWMLVKCLQSHSENKVVWVLVILGMNVGGAFLYWLLEHRKTQPIGQDAN